jgi:hypothetical protein
VAPGPKGKSIKESSWSILDVLKGKGEEGKSDGNQNEKLEAVLLCLFSVRELA